ncbi:MAG: helix-turn-helix domain-containing protein [Acidobacteriaceae bacterium]
MKKQELLGRFPLLEELLAEKGLGLKGTYTNRDVALIFGVSARAIQERTKNGSLKARNLPGRARFLSSDLENFLRDSTTPNSPIPPKETARSPRISRGNS